MVAAYLHRNPRLLVLCVAVIVAAGTAAFLVLPRLEDPVLGRRVAVLSTVYPGAHPRQVEALVTVPLEAQLSGLADIKRIRSNSQHSLSNIVIELRDDVVDVDPVWSLVRDRLADQQLALPQSCRAPELSVIPLQAWALVVALSPAADASPELTSVRPVVRSFANRLAAVSGTERVETFGDPGEEYRVVLSPEALIGTGLPVAAIAEQIRTALDEQPAGTVSGDPADLGIDLALAEDPRERIGDTRIITAAAGRATAVRAIADIRRQPLSPPSSQAVIDGRDAIVVAAMVRNDRRVDRWIAEVQDLLDDIQSRHAATVRFDVLFSQHVQIRQRMQTLLRNLALGTAAVMFVVLILMGWRSMLVVGAALPLSAMMVLAGLRSLAIPIHQMSVTGLIIALGLLIDNAIVMVEDVRSRMVAGCPPVTALDDGIRHLRMPLFGSTLTTAMAFLPVALLPGPPGEFVGTIAVSVILAIGSSFLLAMTVIPALISLLRVRPHQRGLLAYGLSIGPLRSLYRASLRATFQVPFAGVLLGATLPGLGYLAVRELPEQFFPASDRSQIQLEVELPAAAGLAATRRAVDQLQPLLAEQPDIRRQYWFLGHSAPSFYYNVLPRRRGTPFYAQAFVDLSVGADAEAVVRRVQSATDERLTDSRVIVRQLEQGPPFDAPIEIRITGPEPAVLQRLGNEIRGVLAQTPSVVHTRSDLQETIPYLALSVDADQLARTGLDRQQLARLTWTTLEGASAGTVFEDDEEIPVRVLVDLSDEREQEQLAALPLPAAPPAAVSGPPDRAEPYSMRNALTLASLTEPHLSADVGAIVRIDGERTNEVKAYLTAGVLPAQVTEDFRERLQDSGFSLPDGYRLKFGGEAEQRTQAVDKLVANAVVLFTLMVFALVATFQSFRCALLIAAVGGLSIGLGPLALHLAKCPFGFMAIVGSMGLVGVAINDSIVVLAGIRGDSAARCGDLDALTDVVMGCTRHILATTFTTIVGFLPLILTGGGFWPPLAITIAGGVGGATLLALYFVPCAHRLLLGRRQESGPAT